MSSFQWKLEGKKVGIRQGIEMSGGRKEWKRETENGWQKGEDEETGVLGNG